MHKVKTQRSGKLFVKNKLIFHFYAVIIKNYEVEILLNKFSEISRKIGINFRKFSPAKNSPTHNPMHNSHVLFAIVIARCHAVRSFSGSQTVLCGSFIFCDFLQSFWYIYHVFSFCDSMDCGLK